MVLNYEFHLATNTAPNKDGNTGNMHLKKENLCKMDYLPSNGLARTHPGISLSIQTGQSEDYGLPLSHTGNRNLSLEYEDLH